MPITASQHRAQSGTYSNRLSDTISGKHASQPVAQSVRQETPKDISDFSKYIVELSNSVSEMERHSSLPKVSAPALLPSLVILLANVSSTDGQVFAGTSSESVNKTNEPGFTSVTNLNYKPDVTKQDVYNAYLNKTPPLVYRFRRHVPINQQTAAITTTPLPKRDDVKTEKIDFSCIDSRQGLTWTGILRQIGKTLKNPVAALAEESQVIHHLNTYNRCPDEESVKKLTSITQAADQIITLVCGIIPGSQPLVVTQAIGRPVLNMIADSIEGKETDVGDLQEATEQFLSLAQSIKKYSPKDYRGKVIEDELVVPESLTLGKNKLLVEINGVKYDFTNRDGRQYANFGGKLEEISYSWKTHEWFKVDNGKKVYAYSSKDRGSVAVVPAGKQNGRDTYMRLDTETGQPYGEKCVISKKGKLIPLKVAERSIQEFKEEVSSGIPGSCGISARVKRAPCIIDPSPNALGIVEQEGFTRKLYRADTLSPQQLRGRDDGYAFIASENFGGIPKMVPGNAVIVSESLTGVLRYIRGKGKYYIYEIDPTNIKGASLIHNIKNNPAGVKQLMGLDSNTDNIDWHAVTEGASVLHEAHVYHEEVTPDKVKYLGRSDEKFAERLRNLEGGDWEHYL